MSSQPTVLGELRLPADERSSALARRFASDLLAGSAFAARVGDVALVISELVANAVLHGLGEPVLRLSAARARIRIEVRDESPRRPGLRQPGPAGGGWGLHLVDRLAVAWGVIADGPGKIVWCELAATPALTPVSAG